MKRFLQQALALVLFAIVLVALGIPDTTFAETKEERRARLEKELAEVLKEITVQQGILSSKKMETQSLQRDVDIINAEIRKAQLSIRARNLEIERLGGEIVNREKTIEELTEKMEREKGSLAEIIRRTNETDNISLAEVILGKENFSEFFEELDAFQSVKTALKGSLNEIRLTQEAAAAEKELLAVKQDEETNAKYAKEQEKVTLEVKEQEKKKLVTISKTEEAQYEAVIAEKRRKADEIRAALFELRDSGAIPFGQAYEYAKQVGAKTGVRPAFILAILTQETNLGENVGTCNRPGDPPEKQWQAIMKPERDHAPYLRITKALGITPEGQPLSCPWGNGWGGAMGPSQFIPSTWAAYESRIAQTVGVSTPNPWEPLHAFTATALYVADLGAGAQTYTAERTAALKYYAGGNWSNPANAFYGDQVMGHAERIQRTMIDPLLAAEQ